MSLNWTAKRADGDAVTFGYEKPNLLSTGTFTLLVHEQSQMHQWEPTVPQGIFSDYRLPTDNKVLCPFNVVA